MNALEVPQKPGNMFRLNLQQNTTKKRAARTGSPQTVDKLLRQGTDTHGEIVKRGR